MRVLEFALTGVLICIQCDNIENALRISKHTHTHNYYIKSMPYDTERYRVRSLPAPAVRDHRIIIIINNVVEEVAHIAFDIHI